MCSATAHAVKKAIEKTLLFLVTSFICTETTTEEIFYLIVEPEFPFFTSYCSKQKGATCRISYQFFEEYIIIICYSVLGCSTALHERQSTFFGTATGGAAHGVHHGLIVACKSTLLCHAWKSIWVQVSTWFKVVW